MKKYIVEFIGTFFLVLVIALTGNPLAIGIVLTALVYMGGYISGAHYNPAVTLAVLINKKISSTDALRYVIVQLSAAIVASLVYVGIHGSRFFVAPGSQVSMFAAISIEILFTFLLATVVLHVAVSKEVKGNNYFGMAIGFTVMAAAFAGGAISGGAYNPAVGLGPFIVNLFSTGGSLSIFFLYLFGPLIGGALAGILYKYLQA